MGDLAQSNTVEGVDWFRFVPQPRMNTVTLSVPRILISSKISLATTLFTST